MARNMSSVRFRRWGHSPGSRELEWDAVTGRFARRSTSQNPASEMWETSVCIPSSSIRATNSTPLADRPRSGSRAQEPHRALALFHTGFSSRTPHEATVSRCAMSQSSRSAPSMLSSAAVLCWAAAASTSAPVLQRAITSAFSAACAQNQSCIWHSFVHAVPSGSSLTLSNRAKNWARRPYRCPRMRSTWPLFSRRLRPVPMHSYIVSQCPSK